MQEIFGEDFAALAYDALGEDLLTGSLGVVAMTPNAYGKAISSSTIEPVVGLLGRFDVKLMSERGYTAQTMKVVLLANGPNGPITEPKDGMVVTIGGKTMTVKDVTYGAGQAVYTMAGIPARA